MFIYQRVNGKFEEDLTRNTDSAFSGFSKPEFADCSLAEGGRNQKKKLFNRKSPFIMGKSPFTMGKSPFIMAKSTISMGYPETSFNVNFRPLIPSLGTLFFR